MLNSSMRTVQAKLDGDSSLCSHLLPSVYSRYFKDFEGRPSYGFSGSAIRLNRRADTGAKSSANKAINLILVIKAYTRLTEDGQRRIGCTC